MSHVHTIHDPPTTKPSKQAARTSKEKEDVFKKIKEAERVFHQLAKLPDDTREPLMTENLIVELAKLKEKVNAAAKLAGGTGGSGGKDENKVKKDAASMQEGFLKAQQFLLKYQSLKEQVSDAVMKNINNGDFQLIIDPIATTAQDLASQIIRVAATVRVGTAHFR